MRATNEQVKATILKAVNAMLDIGDWECVLENTGLMGGDQGVREVLDFSASNYPIADKHKCSLSLMLPLSMFGKAFGDTPLDAAHGEDK